MKKTGMIFGAALFWACSAAADVDLDLAEEQKPSLGQPNLGGTGCSVGSVMATVTPDGQAVSVNFDNYVAEAGGSLSTVSRKNCNMSFPVHVPAGFSVALPQVDFRGFNSLPSGASSTLLLECFFAGTTGPKFSKRFIGPLSADFEIRYPIQPSAMQWSPCGMDVALRINTSFTVQTNFRREQALAALDSPADSEFFRLQWRRCQE